VLDIARIPLLPFSWQLAVLCLIAGLLIGRWALLLVVLVEVGWWVGADVTGGFHDRSGNGDPTGVEGAAVGFLCALVGCVIVAIGWGLRFGFRRHVAHSAMFKGSGDRATQG
jgi:hypothetical protein